MHDKYYFLHSSIISDYNLETAVRLHLDFGSFAMPIALVLLGCSCAYGFSAPARLTVRAGQAHLSSIPNLLMTSSHESEIVGRRNMVILTTLAFASLLPTSAQASGGATAGKYTTIPIAKRRYFGRVKQGVYEFLLLGEAIKKVMSFHS